MKIYAVVEQYEEDYDNIQHWDARVIRTYHATKELAETKVQQLLDLAIAKLVEDAKSATSQTWIIKQDDLLSRNKVLITNDYAKNDYDTHYEVSKYIVQELEVEE
jgi:predicted MPP superfamily phosphohydrolase